MINIRERVGFLILSSESYFHYRNIFEVMDKRLYDIITNTSNEKKYLNEKGYENVFLLSEIKTNAVYKYLVSEHYCNTGDKNDWIKRIGIKNIRFMYAQGKNKWNFATWNSIYDLILCYGPYQVQKLSVFTETKKIQMGYPRYDDFFNMKHSKDGFVKRFNCDINKKIIVWLPTWKELSSIELYARKMSMLMEHYNVIVKPHPNTIKYEPEKVKILSTYSYTTIMTERFDNLEFFSVADFIVADYGGVPFGAIYTDTNLILLNVGGADEHPEVGIDSAEVFLRKDIINFDPSSFSQIWEVLNDEKYWERQKQIRKELRSNFFAPYYGFSANVASTVLSNLDKVFVF